jgi:MoaA/NifB/PqqE/SkfB family radical SAM enzyme
MKTQKITTYIGFRRTVMDLRIKVNTGIHFLPLLLTGKLSPRLFLRFLKRLLYFLSKMEKNKYVKTAHGTKINLYVPAYPKKAFFEACKKVMEFKDKMPSVTALISVTSACRYQCEHCYQRLDKGKDVDLEPLKKAIVYLQDHGLAFFNIEGGEPFLVYPRLKEICSLIDNRSEILINSTGDGITVERLNELKKKGNLMGIMFSLHTDTPEKLNAFMHHEQAWQNLEKGIEACHEAGVAVTFNTCLLVDDFYNGTFERVMERAKAFGGSLIQLIKPKPAGAWLGSDAVKFNPEDLNVVREKVLNYNNLRVFRDYPAIAPMIIDEDNEHFGCTAGGTDRFYINAKGDVQPCEFLNFSFGNITREPFEAIYTRMRKVFNEPGNCWLCEKYSAHVSKILKENNLTTLPLSEDLSKQLYENLEKGEIPEFYDKVVKI